MVEGEPVWIPLLRPRVLPALTKREHRLKLVEHGGDDRSIEPVVTHVGSCLQVPAAFREGRTSSQEHFPRAQASTPTMDGR